MIELSEQWKHGTRLGREHTSVREHLAEDHSCKPGWLENATDPAIQGAHDGMHGRTWAYGFDLPHGLHEQCPSVDH